MPYLAAEAPAARPGASSTAGSCRSVGSVERHRTVCTESDRPDHSGPTGECRQISTTALPRISRLFEQGERVERPAGTHCASTKVSQELNEPFVWVRFEGAEIFPSRPPFGDELLLFIG